MTARAMPERVYDDGLQLERTTLAWDRTSLAFLANGLLIVRLAGEMTWMRGIGFLVMVLAGLPLVIGRRRYVTRDQQLRAGVDPASPLLLYVVGASAITASGLALLAAGAAVLRGA